MINTFIFCSLEVMMESHVNYMEDLRQLTGNLHISYHLTPPNVEKWSVLPPLPWINSGLVIIDGELCAVGGSHTNQVFTRRWTK